MMFIVFRMLRRVMRHPPSPLRVGVLLVAIVLYGATGFLYFEVPQRPDLGWSDAFWWTFVTLTTVGYGDFAPASLAGRFVVAVPLMVFGIGLLGYVLSLAAAALVEARTRELAGLARMNLENHVIIFNAPSSTKVQRLVHELRQDTGLGKSAQFVLVDEDLEQLPPELDALEIKFVRGNPARDETLGRAAIDNCAHAIVLSKRPGDPHSDEQAIAIVLAVEARKRAIHTVVECVEPSMEELLRKAGTDSIVCTARFDAHFLGSELLNPGSQDVADHLFSTLQGGQQLFMTAIPDGIDTYADVARLCRDHGHLAIGLKHGGALQLNAKTDARVSRGDSVVTIGPGVLHLERAG